MKWLFLQIKASEGWPEARQEGPEGWGSQGLSPSSAAGLGTGGLCLWPGGGEEGLGTWRAPSQSARPSCRFTDQDEATCSVHAVVTAEQDLHEGSGHLAALAEVLACTSSQPRHTRGPRTAPPLYPTSTASTPPKHKLPLDNAGFHAPVDAIHFRTEKALPAAVCRKLGQPCVLCARRRDSLR